MRNIILAIAVTVAIGLSGAFLCKADAAGAAGAVPHGLSGPMSTPVHPAACNGTWGYYGCGPGYQRYCNPAGYCWCGPC